MADDSIIIKIDLDKGDTDTAVKNIGVELNKKGKKIGDNLGTSLGKGLSKGLSNAAGFALKLAGAVTGVGSALIGLQSIRAAQVQEDAINSLNSALTISKNASLDASQGIQAYASELQKSSRFGDETLLQNAALIQSLGDLDEKGLKRALSATTDLATALRIDLTSAATLVGKAAAGEVGSFSRYGLIIKKGADNTETFAKALTAIEGKFGGAAQRDVVTYSGSVDQLFNSYGDLAEEIGKFVTENRSVAGVITLTREAIEDASKNVITFRENLDFSKDVIAPLIDFNNAIITYVVSPLELLGNIAKVPFNFIVGAANSSISAIANVGSAVSKVFDFVGLGNNEATKAIQDFAESSSKVARESEADLIDSVSNIFDFDVSTKLTDKNEALRKFFNDQQEIINENALMTNEGLDLQVEKATENALTIGEIYGEVFNGLTSGVGKAGDSIEDTNKRITEFAQKSGKAMQQGFGRAAGGAFAEFGSAVAKGNASLSTFTDALFKQLGQSAIAMGTNFILEGAAYLFSANPELQAKGPGLIANGAALATFGGFIGGSVGGGAATASASGGGGGGAASPGAFDSTTVAEPTQTRAEPQANLTVNVSGSLVQQEELGGYISEVLSESGAKNNSFITDVRVA